MAKSAVPLILAAGAGALLFMMGKKKKPKSSIATESDLGMLVMNSECTEIINKLNHGDADAWMTRRYNELVDLGISKVETITLQMLKDQSRHCPWDTPSKWTPFMGELYAQYLDAINVWHQTKGGPVRDS